MYETSQEYISSTYPKMEQASQETSSFPYKKMRSPILLILLMSILVAGISLANPLLTTMANDLQSQNLYAIWAMGKGQVPYGQFFGTSGILYYLLAGLSAIVANFTPAVTGSMVFGVFYFLALLATGSTVFQISYLLSGKESLSRSVCLLFYILVAFLGFGGFYASLFALPFLMKSTLFIARYTSQEHQDKGFIGYGMLAAFAFMFEPVSAILFYSVAFLILFFFNIFQKRKSRGIYQLLSTLFGFSIVFYPIGYYTVWNGSFGEAITQVTYPLASLSFTHSNILSNSLYYLIEMIGLGFLTAWYANLVKETIKPLLTIRFLSTIGLFLSPIIWIASPEQGAYQVLPALPYIVIALTIFLDVEFEKGGRRYRRRSKVDHSMLAKYFTKNYFLPLGVMLYLGLSPFVQYYFLSATTHSERATVARYIADNSEETDTIYAWDTDASLYVSSQRLSAIPLLTPTLYQGTQENRLALSTSLANQSAKYIIVNHQVTLLDDIEKKISNEYDLIDLNLTNFILYKLK